MLEAIKKIVEYPEFDSLEIGGRTLYSCGDGWMIREICGSCYSCDSLEVAVEIMEI